MHWGQTCGILIGCLAVLNLSKLHGAAGLADSIMGHYCQTEWPSSQLPDLYDDPDYGNGGTLGYTWCKQPIPDDETLAHVVTNSPLCHISISKWCYAAGVGLSDMGAYAYQHKNDRCGKLTADMAAYTAELINHYALYGASADPFTMPEETASCSSCHGSTAVPGPAQQGKMDCNECHTSHMALHNGKQITFDRLWTEKLVGSDWQVSNTFSAGDKIRYCLRFNIHAPGMVFVRMKPSTSGAEGYKTPSGVWKQGWFNKSDNCNDTGTWRFDNGGGGYTIPADANGQARFKAQIQVGDTSAGPMIYESPLKMVYFTVG